MSDTTPNINGVLNATLNECCSGWLGSSKWKIAAHRAAHTNVNVRCKIQRMAQISTQNSKQIDHRSIVWHANKKNHFGSADWETQSVAECAQRQWRIKCKYDRRTQTYRHTDTISTCTPAKIMAQTIAEWMKWTSVCPRLIYFMFSVRLFYFCVILFVFAFCLCCAFEFERSVEFYLWYVFVCVTIRKSYVASARRQTKILGNECRKQGDETRLAKSSQ